MGHLHLGRLFQRLAGAAGSELRRIVKALVAAAGLAPAGQGKRQEVRARPALLFQTLRMFSLAAPVVQRAAAAAAVVAHHPASALSGNRLVVGVVQVRAGRSDRLVRLAP